MHGLWVTRGRILCATKVDFAKGTRTARHGRTQLAIRREPGARYISRPLAHTPEGMRELDSQASDALAEIVPSYVSTSMLPRLRKMIADAPRPLPQIIPSPQRVLEEKQDLAGRLLQMRSLLQGCGRPTSLPVCATAFRLIRLRTNPRQPGAGMVYANTPRLWRDPLRRTACRHRVASPAAPYRETLGSGCGAACDRSTRL